MTTVLCMKWGTLYGPEYVDHLQAMVARHLARPHRFVCLTDDTSGIRPSIECRPIPEMQLGGSPWYSGWRKLAVFSPDLHDLEGRILFFDLDVVIVGDIEPFFEHPGELCIIENWTQAGQGIGNSSVFRFEAGRFLHLLRDFEAEPDRIIATVANEQTWISQRAAPVSFWPESWVRSFKRHCLPPRPLRWVKAPTLPSEARVIAFHGHPKPPEAAEGVWPGRWIRPAPWVAEHWR
jgi:hypothetical protein